jgi:hypothetical protein
MPALPLESTNATLSVLMLMLPTETPLPVRENDDTMLAVGL